ncbi:hypothetical protein ACFL0V_00405 [Nanoarchaeota archaeon]
MIPIPDSIPKGDQKNIATLAKELEVPFLDVLVINRDYSNRDTYELSVRPKAITQQPASTPNDATELAEAASQGLLDHLIPAGASYVPLMLATQHLFAVLPQLADPGSYSPHMTRSSQHRAQGYTNLTINDTKITVFYVEQAETEKRPEIVIECR